MLLNILFFLHSQIHLKLKENHFSGNLINYKIFLFIILTLIILMYSSVGIKFIIKDHRKKRKLKEKILSHKILEWPNLLDIENLLSNLNIDLIN